MNLERICQWLEEEGDCELYSKMEELSGFSECYSMKYLKDKLIEHNEDHIYFADRPGRLNLLCFKDMTAWELADFKRKKVKVQLISYMLLLN